MSPQLIDNILKQNGYIRPETLAEVDPNLIPLIEDIANEEGLSISETVNRLLKQFQQMEKMMSKMGGGKLRGMMRGMKGMMGRGGPGGMPFG